jgi:dTDP-3-amino-3,4,6-trideoxy-alpha-D-glucose transaminase
MSSPKATLPQLKATEVPFVRLDAADEVLTSEIFGAIERVAAVAAFTMGDELETFEREFAAWCETDHAIGVSSGTSALELALRALGIGPGDEVILPTNSFIATAEAVTATGARPVLVDVDESTALLTAEIVEAALTERTRCVIPVHLYGRSVEMEPLLTLCRAHNLRVVEDACQAHGARYQGRPTGADPPDALTRRGNPPPPRDGGGNAPASLPPSGDPQRQAEAARRVEREPPPGRKGPA